MTRATVEVVGVIEEANANGAVRVANLSFHLTEGKTAHAGQFVRASLIWMAEGHWEATHVSVFEALEQAQPAQQVVHEEPVQQQVAATGTQSRFGGARTTQQPAQTPAPQQAAPQSRFGNAAAPKAPASVIPLRAAPPAAAPAATPAAKPAATPAAKPAAQAPVQAQSPVSRFGSAAAPRTAPAQAQPARTAPAAAAAPQAPKPVATGSRFGNVGTKATSPAQGTSPTSQAASRPAFDASDFDDSDIPF